jgi:urease accessory protein
VPIPTAIITMTMTSSSALVRMIRLLTWLSPAFPTGGFAYSHGLEWSVETGDVADETTLRDWVGDVLSHGAGRSDAILLRHAYTANLDDLSALCALGIALGFGRERRLETCAQGVAFVHAGAVWGGLRITALTGRESPYPIAVGALAADHGIDADIATATYLRAFSAGLISAGVRLIPLGQTAALRVFTQLEPVIVGLVEETRNVELDDLGGACFRSDIAALRHETQRTRLFRT